LPPSPAPAEHPEQLEIDVLALLDAETNLSSVLRLSVNDQSTLERLVATTSAVVDPAMHKSQQGSQTTLKPYQGSIISLEKDAQEEIARQKEEATHLEWLVK
jgi:hypothetical protein